MTCISEHLRDETQRVFAIRREIDVIPNFVNSSIYRRRDDPQLRARYARPDEALLVHLSNFRPVKRVLDCVRVFARLAPKAPAQLLMIGDGPDRAAAETLAVELGVDGRVLFLGEQTSVSRLLGICDILLLPSQMESFGLAALEAMACGAIPIASRVGGLPEVVTDGSDGFLVPAGDVEAMAQVALEVLRDPERQNRMRQAARSTAVARFGSEAVIDRYLALYERVLGCAD